MTCNPNHPAILRELMYGEKPHDRPDVVSRVFRLQLDEMLRLIREEKVMGELAGEVFVIECVRYCVHVIQLREGHPIACSPSS